MKCSPHRVRFDTERLGDIKEAITKADIKTLIQEGAITKKPVQGISRASIRMDADQRRKGRRKGAGSRKGKKTSRLRPKTSWINRIRLQREFLLSARDNGLITKEAFRDLYMKAKGGFFRNKRHLKLYVNEQKLIGKK